MSGHSKWANIKRRKEGQDAKKGKLFTKAANLITAAARQGGGDPTSNFTLRLAIDRARALNMPKDNIERAIARGIGAETSNALTEALYEGFGPGKTAMLISVLTDNKNRALNEVKMAFQKYNGTLGNAGSVAWMFTRKGHLLMTSDALRDKDIDALELALIDAGAEDIRKESEGIEVITKPEDLHRVKEICEQHTVTLEESTLTWIPNDPVTLDSQHESNLDALKNALEDIDDVQEIYTNAT